MSHVTLLLTSSLASLLSLILRLHYTRGVERQQLKWFLFADCGVVHSLEAPSPILHRQALLSQEDSVSLLNQGSASTLAAGGPTLESIQPPAERPAAR